MDHFQLSEDGTRLTGIALHGNGMANGWQYQDLFIVDPNNGQARLLTQGRRLLPYSSEGLPQAWSPDGTQVASIDNFDIESRFPIKHKIISPSRLDFPELDIPTHYPEEGSRLIVLDVVTGAIQTLIQQSTEIIKSDPSDPTDGILRPWSNKRIVWTTNNSGQRGVLFSYKAYRDKLFTNCFIPVPLPGTGQPGQPQPVAESDLPAYGIIKPTFSPSVEQAEAKRKYTLSAISPRGDRAIFYRDDSYTEGSGEPGPDGMTFTWDVYAGRWEVVTSSGKILTNHDQNELKKPFTWTWDGQRPLFLLERVREDIGRYDTFATLDLVSGKLQRMPIPDAIPEPRTLLKLLSPAQAHRAAEYWRHLPNH